MNTKPKTLEKEFKKFSSLLITLLVITICVTIIALFTASSLNNSHKNRYNSYLLADELRQSSDDLTRLARTYCATGEQKYEDQYMGILAWRSGKAPRPDFASIKPKQIIAQTQIMKELGFSQLEMDLLIQAGNNSNDLVSTEVKAMNAIKGFESDGKTPFKGSTFKGSTETSNSMAIRIMFDDKYHRDKAKIMQPIDKFFNELDTRTENNASSVMSAHTWSLIASIACVLTVGILTILMSTTLMKKLFKPLKNLIVEFNRGSKGDLTVKIPIESNDEVAQLADGFNQFMVKLREMLTNVKIAAKDVAGSSSQIANSSNKVADGMKIQSQQTTQVANAISEMSKTTDEIAKQTTEAATNSAETKQQAVDGGDVVQDTVQKMRDVATIAEESSQVIESLGKSSKEIGTVINQIDDIADQTNLLALNATIEAARAGEHGKGFAVVADEVRSLAESTTKLTSEIAKAIGVIQEQAKNAADKMLANTQGVEKGVKLAEDAGHSLSQIEQSSKDVTSMIQSIAATAGEQTAASETIRTNIISINEVSQESAQGAKQAAQAATALSQSAVQLNSLVDQFTLE